MNSLKKLDELITDFGWRSIPDEIISREGVTILTTGERWDLPITNQHSSIIFKNVQNQSLRWSIKVFLIDQIERVSSSQGMHCWRDLLRLIVKRESKFILETTSSVDDFSQKLISIMEDTIAFQKNKHRFCDVYTIVRWYVWCADNYPEIGFCPEYASTLDGLVIPGTPKGEAVRMEDPETGPLHRTLELPLLIDALRTDKCSDYNSLQQKAAVALSLSFGRNPANLTYLKESDFNNLTEDSNNACFVINMPRIKKRFVSSRDDYLQEYLEDEYGYLVKELIEANKKFDTKIKVNGKIVEIERPIFLNENLNSSAFNAGLHEDIFNMFSYQITKLLKAFTKRHKLISPITEEPLQVTTRRLRYTLATGLVADGISSKELARILDHSDTQHVMVYFEVAGKITEYLDKATAKRFAKYLDFFKGKIVDSDVEAINGNRDDKHLIFVNESDPTDQLDIGVCGQSSLCHLDPPYSCYLCPKFQPYRHADHDHVLECLLIDRENRLKKYEDSRLGIQLDDVISAVAQVASICEIKRDDHV